MCSCVELKFNSTFKVEDMNLTLIHESCLPGYSLLNKECVCNEGSDSILFCDPTKEGILLAVRIKRLA